MTMEEADKTSDMPGLLEDLTANGTYILQLMTSRKRHEMLYFEQALTQRIHEDVHQKVDIRNMVQNKSGCNKKLSHSFGAVLGTGTTVFSGPYSYAIVFVDQLDKPEFLVNGEILENNQLVHCHDPICVSVNSGRLVVFAFAFHKA
ncbi:hypothetical protein PTRG_11964 [Pyrenophora tritici-repentis Pt-1C-BFP]|uniref:Uncharacterized protein n=1 Tax=Pyrenophora tritici-repentis (strain Pt-1C-BFP) TaxID=426418 RepID=B2WPL3_PYRTR|nr:uncharacterized protein PTRG_11964 [Pyrenophora tritici-repentis Pt-1C-BFP]EDU46079.1 hypothetical protein PTRG_11964 [Pyrenophora tritici-repentis Pt-1C-BFP]